MALFKNKLWLANVPQNAALYLHLHGEAVMDIFRIRLKERVEWARKNRGWNQEFIADHLGVSRRRLNNWLNTPREPTMETYAELCRLLEMNAGYCLGLTDSPEPTTATEELQQINVKVDRLLKKQV